jgi:hypothetical protein
LNENWKIDLGSGGFRALDSCAAQYIFTNPDTAIVKEGSPLALAGGAIGSQGRAAQLFHQGAILTTFSLSATISSTPALYGATAGCRSSGTSRPAATWAQPACATPSRVGA